VTRRQYAPSVIAAVGEESPHVAAPVIEGVGTAPQPAAPPPTRPATAISAPVPTPKPLPTKPLPTKLLPTKPRPPKARVVPNPVPIPIPVRPAAAAKKGSKAAVPGAPRPARQSSRPELPLKLSFHDALIGADKRAVLENLSDSALEVMLDVKSPVTGAHFSRTFVINPRSFGQVGRAQGWPFARGQLVTVSNPEYRPLVRTVG
jgi:hypothetical protein